MHKKLSLISLLIFLTTGTAYGTVGGFAPGTAVPEKMVNHIDPTTVAQVYVRPYFRSDGTYVRPHFRTRPDGYCWNNYSGC